MANISEAIMSKRAKTIANTVLLVVALSMPVGIFAAGAIFTAIV